MAKVSFVPRIPVPYGPILEPNPAPASSAKELSRTSQSSSENVSSFDWNHFEYAAWNQLYPGRDPKADQNNNQLADGIEWAYGHDPNSYSDYYQGQETDTQSDAAITSTRQATEYRTLGSDGLIELNPYALGRVDFEVPLGKVLYQPTLAYLYAPAAYTPFEHRFYAGQSLIYPMVLDNDTALDLGVDAALRPTWGANEFHMGAGAGGFARLTRNGAQGSRVQAAARFSAHSTARSYGLQTSTESSTETVTDTYVLDAEHTYTESVVTSTESQISSELTTRSTYRSVESDLGLLFDWNSPTWALGHGWGTDLRTLAVYESNPYHYDERKLLDGTLDARLLSPGLRASYLGVYNRTATLASSFGSEAPVYENLSSIYFGNQPLPWLQYEIRPVVALGSAHGNTSADPLKAAQFVLRAQLAGLTISLDATYGDCELAATPPGSTPVGWGDSQPWRTVPSTCYNGSLNLSGKFPAGLRNISAGAAPGGIWSTGVNTEYPVDASKVKVSATGGQDTFLAVADQVTPDRAMLQYVQVQEVTLFTPTPALPEPVPIQVQAQGVAYKAPNTEAESLGGRLKRFEYYDTYFKTFLDQGQSLSVLDFKALTDFNVFIADILAMKNDPQQLAKYNKLSVRAGHAEGLAEYLTAREASLKAITETYLRTQMASIHGAINLKISGHAIAPEILDAFYKTQAQFEDVDAGQNTAMSTFLNGYRQQFDVYANKLKRLAQFDGSDIYPTLLRVTSALDVLVDASRSIDRSMQYIQKQVGISEVDVTRGYGLDDFNDRFFFLGENQQMIQTQIEIVAEYLLNADVSREQVEALMSEKLEYLDKDLYAVAADLEGLKTQAEQIHVYVAKLEEILNAVEKHDEPLKVQGMIREFRLLQYQLMPADAGASSTGFTSANAGTIDALADLPPAVQTANRQVLNRFDALLTVFTVLPESEAEVQSLNSAVVYAVLDMERNAIDLLPAGTQLAQSDLKELQASLVKYGSTRLADISDWDVFLTKNRVFSRLLLHLLFVQTSDAAAVQTLEWRNKGAKTVYRGVGIPPLRDAYAYMPRDTFGKYFSAMVSSSAAYLNDQPEDITLLPVLLKPYGY